ncbi:MAG: hypothetical protein ACLFVG_09805 [Candidatus Aminicenantes bacterium]
MSALSSKKDSSTQNDFSASINQKALPEKPWTLPKEKILRFFGVSEDNGLSSEEADCGDDTFMVESGAEKDIRNIISGVALW